MISTGAIMSSANRTIEKSSSVDCALPSQSAAAAAATASSSSLAPSSSQAQASWLTVGRMVSVAPRTWPGMNRPGGLGHIEKIYTAAAATAAISSSATATTSADGGGPSTTAASVEIEVTHVDVKYLPSELVSRDRGIPIQYISDHHHITMEIMGGNVGAKCGAGRRHRRNLINSRRCSECGSFAIDCGNCDWRNAELRARKRLEEEKEELEKKKKNEQRQREKKRDRLTRYYVSGDSNSTDDGSSSCSSSDDNEDDAIDSEEEEMRKVETMNRHRKRNGQITRRRRGRRWKQKEHDKLDDAHDNEDDTSDEDDEVPLAILQRQIERAMKARERKLRFMQQFLSTGINLDKEKRKSLVQMNKKPSSRTRPQNACALMGMATEVRSSSECVSTMVWNNNPGTKSMGRNNHGTRDGNDSVERMEIDTESSEKINENKDTAGATTTNFEDSDDDLITFGDLRSRATLSSSVKRVGGVTKSRDHSVGNDNPGDNHDVFVEDDGDEVDDKEMDEESGSECDAESEPIDLLNDDDSHDDDGNLKSRISVREIEWGDLPNFINGLCHEVHHQRIVHAQNTLNALKRKLQAIKMGVSRTSLALHTTTSQEVIDTLGKLSEESDALNQYIIEELHRNGVDLCNKALTRLLSKRERRENEDKLTLAQEKLCRIAAVDMWDLRVVELCDLVREVDSKVTSFQKEVEREIQLTDDDYDSVDDDIVGDAYPADESRSAFLESHRTSTKRRSKADDQHPHASRKRKQSSGRGQSYLKTKRLQQGSRRKSDSIGVPSARDADVDAERRRQSSTVEFTSDIDDDHSTIKAVELDGAECTLSFEPVDFVGDMEDLESDQDGYDFVDKSRIGRTLHNTATQHRHSESGSSRLLPRGGSGLGLKRRTRPMADTMSDWLDRQDGGRDGGYHIKISLERLSSEKNENSSRMRQPRSTDRQENESHTARFRIRNSESNNSTRAGSSMTGCEPVIPHELSAEILFDSITDNINRSDDEEQCMNAVSGRTLAELCCELKDRYRTNVRSCRDILYALTTAVLSTTREDTPKNDIITLLQTLLSIFQQKSTTLLDMIQKRPDLASFHIDCWCLVFRMAEKKMHERLCHQDGLLFKIFGNRTILANHILLQIIDALYSQLSREEYGQSPAFNSRVFEELRALCIRIGYVVPLLSSMCDLLTRSLCMPRWYVSLINDQKENKPDEALFVSAIDPGEHKRFMETGDYPNRSQVDYRMRSFKYRIPREEIEGIWAIIGFTSCCSSLKLAAADFKQTQSLLAGLIFYDCGTLPKTDQQFPPSKLQLDTCSTEIKWTSILLSSRLLGDLPSIDSFLKQLVEKSVILEAWDVVLNARCTTAPDAMIEKAVKKLWGYSCVTGASVDLESNLQSALVNVNSIFVASNTSPVYSVCPSSILLQRCVSMAISYSSIIMVKNTRWKNFRTLLLSLAAEFVKRALDVESKSEQRQSATRQSQDDFSDMFHSIIKSATDVQIAEIPTSSHFREAACYTMLAGVVARSRFNVPGEGSNFHLNNTFRENIWRYSSDEKMRKHHTHFLDNMPGDAPEFSGNIFLLGTASKVMTLTALLHLYVSDFSADPSQITKVLRSHLASVKADIDDNVMVYLLTPLIANLVAICGHFESLNKQSRVSENEEQCKAHLNSSKSCADIMRSITTWINLIFGRVKFIVELMAKVAPSGKELAELLVAIKQLATSSFFHFVMKSLTRSLAVIAETATRNTFSKALMKEGCLDKSFRTCLGAIRQCIAFVSTCGTRLHPEVPGLHSNSEWQAAADIYLSFVSKKLIPSIINDNGPVEYHKLCRSQSGGVFSVLAALCSISQTSTALRNMHKLFEPSLAIDDDSRVRLNQIATCFYCELIRLSKHSRDCRTMAMDHIQNLLLYGLAALLDSDTLAMFPTSNLSLLSQLDGHYARSKGNDILSKAQTYSHTPPHDPDQDAFKINRMSGDYFDTAGPTYACKNVWSFLMNMGHVLATSNPYETKYPRHFQSLTSIGRRIVDICNNLHSNELDMVPQISVERECLKRLIVFQKLLVSLTDRENECLDAILGMKGSLFSAISKFIIENLYYLAGVELDVEEQRRIGCNDAITSYHRAKSLAFQRAYSELCGSLMAVMLRENKGQGTLILELVRSLIISAVRGDLELRRTIEEKAMNLNLQLRKRASKGRAHNMTHDFAMSCFRRTSDLLVYSASCSDYRAVLFHAMFHELPSKENDMIESFISSLSSRLVLTSEAIGVYGAVSTDGLERAIDDRILCSEVLRGNDIDVQKWILGLREWAISNFFAALLRSQSTASPLRLVVLKSLDCMIKTFSSTDVSTREKIFDESGNLASNTTFVKLFYSFKECLCNSIRSNNADAIFITELYSCVRQCLELPMLIETTTTSGTHETISLLSWARATSKIDDESNPHSLQCSVYINKISHWFQLCGMLLRQPETTACLRNFLIKVNNHEDAKPVSLGNIETNPDMHQLCSIFCSLNELEGELSLRIANANRVQVSNPYAATDPKSSSTPTSETLVHPHSIESLEAIEKYLQVSKRTQ